MRVLAACSTIALLGLSVAQDISIGGNGGFDEGFGRPVRIQINCGSIQQTSERNTCACVFAVVVRCCLFRRPPRRRRRRRADVRS